jgi:predicted AAA+ superfamily ATPase
MISDFIQTRELLPRAVVPPILRWLDDRQAVVLVGSRQVGKTSILFLLIQHLLAERVHPMNLFYFDLENFDHLALLEKGPESLIQFFHLEGADFTERIYLFIDEIQYLSHPTNFLKLMVDHYPPTGPANKSRSARIKIVCTGSSSLDIRRKFKDSLVGRKIVFEIFSLSFDEFLRFKNETNLLNVLETYRLSALLDKEKLTSAPPKIYIEPLRNHLDEYCCYGGYPAVVLQPAIEKKVALLAEIHSAYVRKDLSSLFTIENIHAFNQLIQLLALGIGNLLNLNTLTADLAISRPTLLNYLTILENTFIIKRLPPFFRRKKREVIKMPKVFFHDLGLRNLVVKQFGELSTRPDRGALVENFSFIHLYRNLPSLNELNFWRTKHGTEVDFILQTQNRLIPVEVKYEAMSRTFIPSGLQSFLTAYPVTHAAVITKDHYAQIKRNKNRVVFLPAWLLSTVSF